MSAINPFKKISANAWNDFQIDAGVVVDEYDLSNPYDEPDDDNIIFTTSGGFHLQHKNNYKDQAEDVDNVPNGMKEFMTIESTDITLDFTALTFNPACVSWGLGAADSIAMSNGITKIVPRNNLKSRDFKTIYCIYPLMKGGALVAKLSNVLSENGFDIQSDKTNKGKSSLSLKVHPSIYSQNTVPVEYYHIPAPELTELTVSSAAGSTTGKSAITISGYTPGSGESFKYKLGTAAEDVEYGDIIGADYTTITSGTSIDASTTVTQKITVVAVDANGYAIGAGNTTVVPKTGE